MSVWVLRSSLPEILRRRGMSLVALREALRRDGCEADQRDLTLLAQDRPAVGKLDMDLVSRVCRALGVSMEQLVHLEELTDEESLRRVAAYRFSAEKQRRLDTLLDMGNAGRLSATQRRELDELVDEFEELSLAAARAQDALRSLGTPLA